MKRSGRFVLVFWTALLSGQIKVQSGDPFLGNWKLDVAQSQYPTGALPRSMTIEMTPAGDAVHYHSETVSEKGAVSHADYVAGYDGKAVIVAGSHGLLLPIAIRRPGADTVIATYLRGLDVVATSRRVVSEKGALMIITTVWQDAAGKEVTSIGIYRRFTELIPLLHTQESRSQ